MAKSIIIKGARVHNLKNIDVKICYEIKSNNAEKESYNITKWDLF